MPETAMKSTQNNWLSSFKSIMCERVSKCIVNLILYARYIMRKTYRILK